MRPRPRTISLLVVPAMLFALVATALPAAAGSSFAAAILGSQEYPGWL